MRIKGPFGNFTVYFIEGYSKTAEKSRVGGVGGVIREKNVVCFARGIRVAVFNC